MSPASASQTALPPEEADAFRRIGRMLSEHAAVEVASLPQARVLRRLNKRLRRQALESLAAYADLLAQQPDELQLLAQHLLLPQAQIFRDPELHVALARALPRWFADCPRPQVWVPGCGPGEEVVALALLMGQVLQGGPAAAGWRLLGSDVDPDALALARSGRLSASELRAVPSDLRSQLLADADGGAMLQPALLERCSFLLHDVIEPPPLNGIDLISCRSVLEGLALPLQRQVQEALHGALHPQGHLLVGARERALVHPDLFAAHPDDRDIALPALFRRVERRQRRQTPQPAAVPAAEALLSVLREPAVVVTGEGRVVTANPAFSGLVNRPLDHLVNSDARVWLQPDALFSDVGSEHDDQKAMVRAVSGLKPVRVSTRPLGTDTLLVLRPEPAVADGTPAPTANQRRLTMIGALLREAVITTDGEGHIVEFSGAAERLTGWRRDEALGQPYERVLRLLDAGGTAVNHLLLPVLSAAPQALNREDCTLIARDGRRISVRVDALALDDAGAGAIVVIADTTEQILLAEQLAYRSTHDPVTGLVNRDEFERRLSTALLGARRQQVRHLFAYLDLDQFKVINDTLGHFAGDELLRQFASLLRGRLRPQDTLARLGGDEFGILVDSLETDEALRLVEGLMEAARQFRFQWEGRAYGLTLSIGAVPIDAHTAGAARVLSEADAACYAAKDAGRDRLRVAGASDEFSRRQGEMGMVARINRALDHHRFELHYEDVVRCGEPAQVVYRELLVRLRDEDTPGKLVPPNLFIPAAERFFLMGALDRWVVNAALAGIAQRPVDGVLYAVNLSGLTVNDEKFVGYLLSRFDHYGVAPEQLCFEITETAAITHLSEARRFIQRLADVGCRFALDDFGAGMASFSYLRNLPVSFIKIDGSFVRSMLQSRVDRGMVDAINRIGHEMGLKTIAEHVEEPELLKTLAAMGVDYAQGWAVSRGRPFSELLGEGGGGGGG